MEGKNTVLAIKCKHCGKQFKIAVPKKQGTFRFVCPSCGNAVEVRFAAKPKVQESNVASLAVKADRPAPKKGATAASLPERKPTKKLPGNGLYGKGCLEIVRLGGLLGGIANTRFPLSIGMNTVGRADEDRPSDINIKNDPTISRRSIAIEVILKEDKGYQFKMKVLRAANPVLHNDKPLIEGEIIYLNYGDSIKLGRTTLRFNKL